MSISGQFCQNHCKPLFTCTGRSGKNATRQSYSLVYSRPATSMGHQGGRRVLWEGLEFFKLCLRVLNDVLHIFHVGRKVLQNGASPPCAPGYVPGILYRHWVQRMSDSHIFTIKLWLRNVLFTSYLQNIVVAKLLVFKLHHTFVWKIGFGKLFHWSILNEIFHFVFIQPNMFIFCGLM